MNELTDALHSNRLAVDAVIAAAEASGPAWAVARAPGKWSPAQIVEHLARSMEESANEVAGMPSKFPIFPSLVRPLVRAVFFNRTLRKQAFPKARTNKSMDPAFGPETPAAGRHRLEEAFHKFDRACRAAVGRSSVFESKLFGKVSVVDYVRFQDLHTRHHLRQISDSARVAAST